MTLTEVGSAAALPQPRVSDDVLLDAIRRSLAPGDPVARLLAGWTAPPARPVATHVVRSGPVLLGG